MTTLDQAMLRTVFVLFDIIGWGITGIRLDIL